MNIENARPKRLLIYAHYDPHGKLDPHVIYQIASYAAFGIKIIFVSNSPLTCVDRECLIKIGCEVHTRPNIGFDFVAWKSRLLDLGREGLRAYNEIILANDSVYGPFFPLTEMFGTMDQIGVDFWGITGEIGNKGAYLHSYFLDFRPSVFLSDVFLDFWRTLPEVESFLEGVEKGGLRISKILEEAGFIFASFIDPPEVPLLPAIGPDVPLAHTLTPFFIERYRVPFIKIRAFSTRPGKMFNEGPRVFEALENTRSEYPVDLISRHLVRAKPLSWSKNQPGFLNVFPEDGEILPDPGLKIAAFLHLHYLAKLGEALSWLSNIPYKFDLYIATSSEEKKEILQQSNLQQLIPNIGELEIRVFENRGRDVAPWLLGFKDVQMKYDLALKFHMKVRVHFGEVFIDEWTHFIYHCTLASQPYVSRIIDLFCSRPELGTVFHPYAPAIILLQHEKPLFSSLSQAQCRNALKAMGMNETMESSFPVFSQNLFWYRPQALAKLFTSNISIKDFLPEPYPVDGALGHGLERVIPYVAQNGGYANALVMPEDLLLESYLNYEDHILNFEPAGWRQMRSGQ